MKNFLQTVWPASSLAQPNFLNRLSFLDPLELLMILRKKTSNSIYQAPIIVKNFLTYFAPSHNCCTWSNNYDCTVVPSSFSELYSLPWLWGVWCWTLFHSFSYLTFSCPVVEPLHFLYCISHWIRSRVLVTIIHKGGNIDKMSAEQYLNTHIIIV